MHQAKIQLEAKTRNETCAQQELPLSEQPDESLNVTAQKLNEPLEIYGHQQMTSESPQKLSDSINIRKMVYTEASIMKNDIQSGLHDAITDTPLDVSDMLGKQNVEFLNIIKDQNNTFQETVKEYVSKSYDQSVAVHVS